MLQRIQAPVRQAWKDFGFGTGSLYLLARALDRLSRGRCRIVRYHLVAQPIPTQPTPTCPPSATDYVVEATASTPERAAFPRPADVITQRFDNRHACLMSLSKGRFTGFLWLAYGAYDEDEVHCRFVLAHPEDSVWDFDVMVEPKFRFGRTFARLWDAANARLAAQHIRWSFSRISAFNLASARAHERMGLVKLHTLTFACLGPLQIAFMSCKPRLHICWSARGAPTVILAVPADSNADAMPRPSDPIQPHT